MAWLVRGIALINKRNLVTWANGGTPCCLCVAPIMVIVEFCSYGDLQSYLRHCRGVEDKYYDELYKAPIEKLGSRDLLSFAIQTARGMAHLAGMKVKCLKTITIIQKVEIRQLSLTKSKWSVDG